MKTYRYLTGIIIFSAILFTFLCNAEESEIVVNCASGKGVVNQRIFGNNIIAYDPKTYETWHDWTGKEYYGFSDYGAGIWDSKWNEPVKEVVELAKNAGISIMRFPGGCGTHHYDWKKTIGKNREHFLYGLDEFLITCQAMGSEAVITLSYYTGDEKDAADLVEYLNVKDDGKHEWASERTKNGHKEPYGIKYFEIGNEISHGDHHNIKKVTPEEYASKYLKYYETMKKVEPSIQVGVVLENYDWDKRLLSIIGDKLDFGIVHTYPSPGVDNDRLAQMSASDIYKITLSVPILKDERDFREISKLLKEKTGKMVPLAITEYNGGFVQDKPVPYRHCLGTALLNAELLRIFAQPENNILMANHWNFNNGYTGMVTNGFDGTYKTLNQLYYKRPNYYVFEIYHKHFGDLLLDADVKCGSYTVSGKEIPYLSVNTSKNADGSKVYLMVVNKNMDKSETSTIGLKDFVPSSKGNAWVLNGPSIDATNEINHDNVKVTHHEFEIKGNPFEFTFEPHSLTAIEIERAK